MNKQMRDEIARRNALFNGATTKQKRILIARDVLEQIKVQKIVPQTGSFIQLPYIYGIKGDDSLRETLMRETVSCDCCAVGSLFASCTLFNNEETISSANGNDIGDIMTKGVKSANQLSEYFSRKQLILIEVAFETMRRSYSGAAKEYDRFEGRFPLSQEEIKSAELFYSKYEGSESRLCGIMHNIIQNDGLFKP